MMWLKIMLYSVAGIFFIFNILYTYSLSTDKIRYNIYLKRWEKIKQECWTDFAEMKSSSISIVSNKVFHPDVIIKRKEITMEISNSVSSELLKQLEGFFRI